MKFQKFRLLLPLLAISLPAFIASCASDKEPAGGIVKKELPANKKAPEKVEDSIQPVKAGTDFTGAEGSLIKLKKSSLGRVFLMSMTLSAGDNAVRRNVLLPKVVKFEFNGSELALTEENYQSVYNEIPSAKLLQTFKVEGQDAETVTFRWDYGLSTIPAKGFYVVSDSGPDAIKAAVDPNEEVNVAAKSFLRSAVIKDNRLELRQISAVHDLEAMLDDKTKKIATGVKESSLLLDISIAPYVENKRFQPRLSTKQDGVGFFETARVRKEEGPIDVFASRWDLSEEAGPITYKISKNSPPEAVEAMKEGVLYWNNVLKNALNREKDLIVVQTGADPQEAPTPRSVIVYWVPFATAGSAYANFQPDPLTGEITSGLVYQTSVFFLSGKQRGRRFLNRGVESRAREVAPAGFRAAQICNFPEPHDLAAEAKAATDGAADEKMGLKFATDYLRHVVAHEVGHTLGLRHNFAGNLASELKGPAENREKFKEYLNDPNHSGAKTTSSVMEYLTFRDVIMEGATLRKEIYGYDLAAMKWGYGKDYVKADDIQAPYFCTDVEGGGGKTFGCSTDDSGPRPIAGHAAGVARSKSLAADIVVEALVDAIRPDNENDAVSVRKALAGNHPDKIANSIGVELPHFLRLGGAGVKHIAIDRKNKGPNWANQEAYGKETIEKINEEYADAGGLPGILKTVYDLDENFKAKKGWLKEAVIARTSAEGFGKGKRLSGAPYELTEQEKSEVKAAAEKLADAAEASLLRDVFLAVTGFVPAEVSGGAGKVTPALLVSYPDGMKTWAPYVPQDSWQENLGKIAEGVVLDSDGEIEGTVDGNAVKVPQPKFAPEARLAALRLYNAKAFGRPAAEAWMKDQDAALTKALVDRLAPVIKVDPSNGKVEPVGKPSKNLEDWAKKELAMLVALKTARK